jgi:glycosyltransferase involved in cell wall biosynthesis
MLEAVAITDGKRIISIGKIDFATNNERYVKRGWRLVCPDTVEQRRKVSEYPHTEKPRLVHAVPWDLPIGGISRMLSLHAPFTSQIYDVHIIHTGKADAFAYPGCTLHGVKDGREGDDLCRRLAPDLLVHHGPQQGFVRYSDCPVVWVIHSQVVFQMVCPNWCIPEAILSNYPPHPERMGRNWKRFDIIPIPLGVPLSRDCEAGVYAPAIDRPDKLVAGIVGRLSPEKCPRTFIDKIKAWDSRGWTIRFIGAGFANGYQPVVKELLAACPFVEFVGDVAPDDMPEQYRKLSALLVPSKIESGSYAIVEAMACGVPIIARDVGGVSFTTGGAATLCDSDDSLLAALADLSPEAILVRSKAVFEAAYRRHRVECHVQAHLDAYKAALPIEPTCERIDNPRIGLIARADEGGLAQVSLGLFKHLNPASVMAYCPGWMPEHLDRYPGAMVVNKAPTDNEIREFLVGLDVVITLETPYNWKLFTIAREMGVRSIMMVDYEYTPDPLPTKPDLLWAHNDWHLDDIRKLGPTVYIPMPVDREQFAFRLRKKALTFVAVLGNKVGEDDREGVATILAAIPLVKNRDVRFILHSRFPIPEMQDSRVTIDSTSKANAQDNWNEGDVLIRPRHYAGPSLPVYEALSCGMPVLMTDIAPQNKFLPKHWLLPCKMNTISIFGHEIERGVVAPETLAAKIDEWAGRDIEADSLLANQIAETMSWDTALPKMKAMIQEPPQKIVDNAHFSLLLPKTDKPLRIAYVGNFRSTWTTENDIAISLRDLGHDVIEIQEDDQRTAKQVIDKLAGCDLLMWTHSNMWDALEKEWPKVWEHCRKVGIKTATYHLDIYFGVAMRSHVATRANPFFCADYVFTADGGHQKDFAEAGINHFYFPPAICAREAFLGEYQARLASDIIFVGSYPYPHKDWRFRDNMIGAIKQRYGAKFRKWPDHPHQMRHRELADLYASAKIVIGDSFYSPQYWSDRFPETIGRGGFMIAPYIEGIEANFIPGKHFVAFDHQKGKLTDFSELFDLIDRYLPNVAEREKIRRAGLDHVRQYHTYQHRMIEMLQIVGLQ